MNTLIIINDPPYGTERAWNALRLATNLLVKHEDVALSVFLLGDAVGVAKSGQQTPNGYYNLERMIENILRKSAKVLTCGTCMDARGLTQDDLIEGTVRSTMDELTALTYDAVKVLVF